MAHRALKAHTSTHKAHRALKAHTSTHKAHKALKAHNTPRAPSLLLVSAEDVFEGHHTLQDPLAGPILYGQNRPT
jgi:hypothetical protein